MNKTAQLPLYIKFYQFIKTMYEVIKSFSKHYKYTLGEDIIKFAWQCLDLVIETNLLPNLKKEQKISELSQIFDKLKLRLRMCQELNLISKKQYSHITMNYTLEIGRMIGSWLEWSKNITIKNPD